MATSEPLWHVETLDDAQRARDWVAERSPLAARGFLLELADAVEAVIEAPRRWPTGKADTRWYVFPHKYPFTLVYRLMGGEVHIVAVAHQERHPDYWHQR